MIHIQVKAKSGLHAGAVWRLDNSLVSLGANSQSDVFLCDPEIPDTLITLRKSGRRFNIETLHSEARLTAPDQKKVDNTLFPSQLLTLDFKHIQIELQIVNGTSGLMSSLNDGVARTLHQLVQLLRGIGARAIVALLFIIGLLLTTVVLFFGTAGVVKSEASVIKKPDLNNTYKLKPLSTLESRMAENVANEINDFAIRASTNQLSVTVDDDRVDIDAELSRAQSIGFEKLLDRLVIDYGEKVDIRARLALTEEQRRIDEIAIEQVVLGSRPVVILRDGARLYVGGQYQGVNLLSVDSRKVVFQGETVYEVVL
ncbi:hypothetical protein [Limnobacter sp. MED105]|jgi:hypothetical protein|uniref:hypothetical protein n=1 Tax=unclassified Limnobacter TaxID=2630203 RepID=UPI000156CA4A|nr:hypothetical protein [Limnobacter sp. MED105]EDM84589.1 hypothetical protein LMED105_03540 [Limnobacter sp. MED105]